MSEIVVVGGSGWAGTELVRRLIAERADFSVVSHSDSGAAHLRATGARSVVRANLEDSSTLIEAFNGARVVYAIPPTLHQREDELIINAIRAAESSGVEHFTYHSVMHPNTPFLRNHVRKSRVESVLQSSRLSWTIVQPSVYSQVILAMFATHPAGRVVVPFDADSELAMVDLGDCAEVGVKILTESREHSYATYELAGPVVSLRHCVAEVATARRIDLTVEKVPISDAVLPPAARTSAQSAADMISTFAHYDQHGFRGNSFILAQLLGRSPTTFAEVAERRLRDTTASIAD
ncbi:SDR family oxidoreductase [Nocardia fusca]|uniref:SDR family oxidoreductase n=1 Tax=Nocardia fusca TaxID=941183 RepID=UPI0037C7DA40